MDNVHSFWQLGDELRGQTKMSEDHKWLMAASKLAEQTRSKGERMNNLDFSKATTDLRPRDRFGFHEENNLDFSKATTDLRPRDRYGFHEENNLDFSKATTDLRPRDRFGFHEENKFESLSFNMNMLSLDSKGPENLTKNSFGNNAYNMSSIYPKTNVNFNRMENMVINKSNINKLSNKEPINNLSNSNNNNSNNDNANDKRFKTLPAAETLPRNEILGGYIFVCNNDTMQENLKRQLFGLPPRYRDSVRAITPGLPLFLYNYTTHQLHGIFEASTFGGSNIDPLAWEDKKCKGESRFPAQVRIRIRKLCKALEEDSFRPVLHHYDGPKFRLELSVSETLELLDLCEQGGV